jgi:hypothetical protein
MMNENKILEDFLELCRKTGFNPHGLEEFAKKMLTSGPLCDTVPNAQGEFGYDKSNPIPVCNPDGEMAYLRSLRCQCGEPLEVECRANYGPGPDGHMIDGFDLVCKTGTHQITLYMDMYHLGPSTRVPKHLKKANG